MKQVPLSFQFLVGVAAFLCLGSDKPFIPVSKKYRDGKEVALVKTWKSLQILFKEQLLQECNMENCKKTRKEAGVVLP
ncbi:hypothetical protein [Rufibacter latericius]|uniref:Uncharacterized protein n=1 Tax=Rufibacter latericius TaxID=2487040 RepID=A0A3M9MCV9_9BACT|nr:hypothetical protein [Rufibacter latericius]RNI23376.1 hypothetical protein EFB08_17665 [Rufibacter latericius]